MKQASNASDGEAIVDGPLALRDVVSVQVLLRVVPADRVQAVLDLEDHCGEGADRGQVALSVDRLIVRVEDKSCIRSVLLVEASKDQDRARIDLIGHCEIARHPVRLILHVDYVPYVPLDVVALADVRDLLRAKLDATREDVNELSIEHAASCRVPGNVQICHSNPFIRTDIVVFASTVEIFRIVPSNYIDAVFL